MVNRFNLDVAIGSQFDAAGFDQAEARVAKFAAATSAALVATGAAAIKSAASFDEGFRQVNTIVRLSGRELEEFREGARNLLGDAEQDAEDLNKALFDLVSAGVPAANALQSLALAADAATAGNASLTDSVNAGVSVVNAFGLAQEELEQVFDVQFATIQRGVTTFAELSQAQGELIPQAAALNVTYQEMFGALAFLTTQGQRTRIAAGGLRVAFQGLGEQSERLAELGVRVFDEFGAFRGLIPVLEDFRSSLQDATDVEVAEFFQLAQLPVESQRALVPMLQQFARFQKTVEDVAEASEGAMTEAAEEMKAGVTFQMRTLRNSVESALIGIGDIILPEFQKVISGVEGAVDAFDELDPAAKKVGVVGSEVFVAATALGLLEGIAKKSFRGFGVAATAARAAAAFLLGPTGIIVAGGAAALAVIVKIAQETAATKREFEAFGRIGADSLEEIARKADEIAPRLANVFPEVSEAIPSGAGVASDVVVRIVDPDGQPIEEGFPFGLVQRTIPTIDVPLRLVDESGTPITIERFLSQAIGGGTDFRVVLTGDPEVARLQLEILRATRELDLIFEEGRERTDSPVAVRLRLAELEEQLAEARGRVAEETAAGILTAAELVETFETLKARFEEFADVEVETPDLDPAPVRELTQAFTENELHVLGMVNALAQFEGASTDTLTQLERQAVLAQVTASAQSDAAAAAELFLASIRFETGARAELAAQLDAALAQAGETLTAEQRIVALRILESEAISKTSDEIQELLEELGQIEIEPGGTKQKDPSQGLQNTIVRSWSGTLGRILVDTKRTGNAIEQAMANILQSFVSTFLRGLLRSIPVIGGFFGGGGIAGAQLGGIVSGGTPGVDSVPILAQAGEIIVPRRLSGELLSFFSTIQTGIGKAQAGGVVSAGASRAPTIEPNVNIFVDGNVSAGQMLELVQSPEFAEAFKTTLSDGILIPPDPGA